MKVHIETENYTPDVALRVGNVYPVRGGSGLKNGHMMICIAITEAKPCVGSGALMLVIDRQGNPVNVDKYGVHVFEDRAPIAFAKGVEDIELFIQSI
jgi:hypothetical protein